MPGPVCFINRDLNEHRVGRSPVSRFGTSAAWQNARHRCKIFPAAGDIMDRYPAIDGAAAQRRDCANTDHEPINVVAESRFAKHLPPVLFLLCQIVDIK